MFYRRRYLCSALAALALAATSWSTARADFTAYLNDVERNPNTGQWNTFDLKTNTTVSHNGAITGAIQWTATSAGGPVANTQRFDTFCIEILENVGIYSTSSWSGVGVSLASAPTDTTAITNPDGGSGMGTTKANLIIELYNLVSEGVGLGNVVQQMTPTTSLNGNQAAAFQLAVWEIVYENSIGHLQTDGTGLTVNGGTFSATGNNSADENAIISLANTWLGDLNSSYYDDGLSVVALTNTGSQDQAYAIVHTNPQIGTGTPLPATFGNSLFLAGGFAAAYGIYRRVKPKVA